MAVESQVLPNRQKRHSIPWTFFLFRISPWRAPITGFVSGIVLLALLMLLEFGSGRPQGLLSGVPAIVVGCEYLLGDYRIGILAVILLAYSMTARYILAKWTHQTAAILARPDFVDAETIADTRRWGFIPGLAGSLLCLTFAADIAQRDVAWTRDYWILPHVINWAWCIPFGWIGGRLIYALIFNAVLISRAARNIEVNDLSETAPIDGAIRHGTRSALLSLMLLGLVSVHFLDPGLGLPAVVFLISLFFIGAAISALPAIGVGKVFYDQRDQQLAALRRELEIEEQQLISKDLDYEPGRISDIVALEQRLQNWSVTIFHTSIIVRLALYTLVGFMSWLGAAAVSLAVENFFGF